jgi:nitrogen regulatory protein PII
MANLLVLILDELEKFPAILEAWEQAGVPGITVLDSVGTRQLKERVSRDDMPLLPSLRSLFTADEDHNRTLFTVIQDDEVLERAIAATQKVVGDFMQPHTGILFVVSVPRAWGVPKAKRGRKSTANPRG